MICLSPRTSSVVPREAENLHCSSIQTTTSGDLDLIEDLLSNPIDKIQIQLNYTKYAIEIPKVSHCKHFSIICCMQRWHYLYGKARSFIIIAIHNCKSHIVIKQSDEPAANAWPFGRQSKSTCVNVYLRRIINTQSTLKPRKSLRTLRWPR